jgi:hypothetical protein
MATEFNAKTQRRQGAGNGAFCKDLCVSAPLRLCVKIGRAEINGSRRATPKTATGTGALPSKDPMGGRASGWLAAKTLPKAVWGGRTAEGNFILALDHKRQVHMRDASEGDGQNKSGLTKA